MPPAVLALTLIAPALDVVGLAQPYPVVGQVGVFAAAIATAVLVTCWLRFPRTNWLAAASFAAVAGVVLRLLGDDVAPLLSLLSIVALGIGGAFATRDRRYISLVDA